MSPVTRVVWSGTSFASGEGMRPFVLWMCLLGATACAQSIPTGPTVRLDQRFALAPGQIAVVGQADLRIQFVDVSGDSRCPADAVCILGGDALVHIRVLEGARSDAYELHTGDASRAVVTHGPFRIGLVELQPYPFSSRTIQPDEYRATFTVSRP